MSNANCSTVRQPHADVSDAAGVAHGLLLSLTRGVSLLFDWQERAAQRRHLAEMPDYLLKDVGLSRADVMREASKHFWND